MRIIIIGKNCVNNRLCNITNGGKPATNSGSVIYSVIMLIVNDVFAMFTIVKLK